MPDELTRFDDEKNSLDDKIVREYFVGGYVQTTFCLTSDDKHMPKQITEECLPLSMLLNAVSKSHKERNWLENISYMNGTYDDMCNEFDLEDSEEDEDSDDDDVSYLVW